MCNAQLVKNPWYILFHMMPIRRVRPDSLQPLSSGSSAPRGQCRRSLLTTTGAAVLLSIGLLASGCGKKKAEERPHMPRAVTAATAQAKDLPLYIDSLGRTTAYESVQIVPQVGGTLEKIAFKQGTIVKKGDLLFEIEPALYRAAVLQAEGALKQAQAQLQIDELQLERSRSLLPDKLISEQEFQALEAKVEGNRGAMQLAQGQLDSARVNLGYAVISAPVEGLIGFYEVTQGNVVSAASATMLTSIQRLDPLYVDFTVTDRDFISLRQHYFEQDNQLPVIIRYISGDGDVSREAKLKVLGNEVNRSSGTVRLRAEVKNEDYAFWPEQPISARVILTTLKDAVVVPSEAIGNGQMGTYVFVINEKDGKLEVEQVTVKVGQFHDDGQTIIVTEGLKAGQRVVLEGQVFLQSGQEVVIKEPAPKAAASKPVAAAKATDGTDAAKSTEGKPAEGKSAAGASH